MGSASQPSNTIGRQSRIAFLLERVRVADAAKDRATFPVPFRGRQINPVVVEVALDFPLYNVHSGRTHRAQSEYIDQHGLPADYFSDPEDEQAQHAQEQLLLQMVDERGLASDLLQRHQKSPLVLTYDGYVIDGNRRLAALRRDRATEYVRAVVLPEDATRPELFDTELELQMSRETKAEYNWIDEALHVHYGLTELYEMKSPRDAMHALASRMNVDDKEVTSILNRLQMVDLYLEWLGQPGKYHVIPAEHGGTMQQAFREMCDRLATQQVKRLPRDQQLAIRVACFSAISSGAGYKDIRGLIDSMRSQPAAVVERMRGYLTPALAEHLDRAETPALTTAPAATESPSLLDQLAESEQGGVQPGGLQILNLVSNSVTGRLAGPALINVAQDLDTERRESLRKPEATIHLDRVLRTVREIQLSANTRQLDHVSKLLSELAGEIDRLAAQVQELRSAQE